MSANDPSNSNFLRNAFRANGAFSGLSGLVMLVADGMVAVVLDAYDALGAIRFVGLNLVVFSAFLFWLASRERIATALTWAVIGADLVWVLGSWLAIGAGMTSGGGTWAVAIVADIVLVFAILQWFGLWKMERAAAAA